MVTHQIFWEKLQILQVTHPKFQVFHQIHWEVLQIHLDLHPKLLDLHQIFWELLLKLQVTLPPWAPFKGNLREDLRLLHKLRLEGHLPEAVYAAVDVVVARGEADALDLSTSLD